jgi:hypothetical protein
MGAKVYTKYTCEEARIHASVYRHTAYWTALISGEEAWDGSTLKAGRRRHRQIYARSRATLLSYLGEDRALRVFFQSDRKYVLIALEGILQAARDEPRCLMHQDCAECAELGRACLERREQEERDNWSPDNPVFQTSLTARARLRMYEPAWVEEERERQERRENQELLAAFEAGDHRFVLDRLARDV